MKTTETGSVGEKCAAAFLVKKGYDIVTLNYHSKFGEIDIIARTDEYIVFIEVKTRSSNPLYSAKEAVNAVKQRKIVSTALQFLSLCPVDLQPRFDVIEVYYEKGLLQKKRIINHIENAFEPEECSNAIF